jgi:hypothetical protein
VAIVGKRIEPKPERGQYEDRDVHSLSSDITTFNLYEQDWQTLVNEGLAQLFANKEDFEQRRLNDVKKN